MKQDNYFTVLVPSYNVEKWAEKNVTSILNQNYENYDVYYIDDCSTDNTYEIVDNVFKNYHDHSKITFLKNSFNRGKMYNVYEAMKNIEDDAIVLIVDGDDWLKHPDVLNILNKVYKDDVWMTAGSYIESDTLRKVSPNISNDYWSGIIRKKSWQTSHLATFRKKLLSKIKKRDFMHKTGDWFSTTSDQAIMWPMLEMSGKKHFKPIDEVLYVYNRGNPISDDRAFREDQLITEHIIRNLKPYQELESL